MSKATRMIPSAENKPSETTLTLSEQLHDAEQYAQRADAAIPRATSPEAREAGIRAATMAWEKVANLKGLVNQEKHREIVKAVEDAKTTETKPVEVVLATATEMVRFTAYSDTVTISTIKRGERIPRKLTTTVEHARAEYARLRAAGYYVW